MLLWLGPSILRLWVRCHWPHYWSGLPAVVTPSLHQAGHCLLWDTGWSLDEGWVPNGVDAFLRKVHLQVCIQGCVFFKSQPEVGFQISSADSVCLKFFLFICLDWPVRS